MFIDMNMCRDYAYYVDALSAEVVELGTRTYPYKDLETVFVEILQLHSNKPHEVSIYIKEGTRNYLHLDKNYIVNMTKVTITTYTNGISESGRALFIGTNYQNKKSVPVISSMLVVLKSLERPVSDTLKSYGALTSNEIVSLVNGISVLHVIKTDVSVTKINFSTKHTDEFKANVFLKLTHPKGTWLELMNSQVDVSGKFIITYQQSNFRLDSIVFDLYRSLAAIEINEYCEDQSVLYESEFHANNITVMHSKLAINPAFRVPFYLYTGGNIFLSNIVIALSPTAYNIVFYAAFIET